MDTPKILATLGIIALVGLYGVYQVWVYREKGMGGPELTGPARILSRRVTRGQAPTMGSHWNYRVTFALADGEQIELYTTEFDYGILKEGLTGRLTWQGKTFLDFESAPV